MDAAQALRRVAVSDAVNAGDQMTLCP